MCDRSGPHSTSSSGRPATGRDQRTTASDLDQHPAASANERAATVPNQLTAAHAHQRASSSADLDESAASYADESAPTVPNQPTAPHADESAPADADECATTASAASAPVAG